MDEFYEFARDVVHLDFAALTDHDYSLTTDEWRLIQEGAIAYNHPERFVTFLGYEWAWNEGPDADHGHRNVLFARDSMPLICSSWHGSNTPRELFDILRRVCGDPSEAISIPHHPMRRANRIWHDWDTMDPEFERLVEVFSSWGSSEKEGEPFALKGRNDPRQWEQAEEDVHPPFEAVGHSLQDGLAMGHRFGFVGGSESHDGRAGSSTMIAHLPIRKVRHNYWAGLTGIWSRRRTRECMWSSLLRRRTLATTGPRIYADMEIDGHPMGDIVRISHAPRRLSVRVHGTAEIERVCVVRNNEDWRTFKPGSLGCVEVIEDMPRPECVDRYYLRVTQTDGHMAWCSPLFVGEGP